MLKTIRLCIQGNLSNFVTFSLLLKSVGAKVRLHCM